MSVVERFRSTEPIILGPRAARPLLLNATSLIVSLNRNLIELVA
jgi:hypothetical protein